MPVSGVECGRLAREQGNYVMPVRRMTWLWEESLELGGWHQDDERTLADAVGLLGKRVDDLVGPSVLATGLPGPSVYDQVVECLPTGGVWSKGKGNNRRSIPPVWVSGMAWVEDMDGHSVGWTTPTPWGARYPGGLHDPAPLRLLWLSEQHPRPQDVAVVRRWVAVLDSLFASAVKLLDPVRFTIAAPCPECGASSVDLPDDLGEMVAHPSLRVRSESADCGACGAIWRGGEVLDLAAAVNGLSPHG